VADACNYSRLRRSASVRQNGQMASTNFRELQRPRCRLLPRLAPSSGRGSLRLATAGAGGTLHSARLGDGGLVFEQGTTDRGVRHGDRISAPRFTAVSRPNRKATCDKGRQSLRRKTRPRCRRVNRERPGRSPFRRGVADAARRCLMRVSWGDSAILARIARGKLRRRDHVVGAKRLHRRTCGDERGKLRRSPGWREWRRGRSRMSACGAANAGTEVEGGRTADAAVLREQIWE